MQVGRVRQPAAEPVDRLADDDVEATLGGVGDQLLEPGPEAACAADGGVAVGPCDRPALRLGVASADLDLVLDRGLPLEIRGIAGVDNGAHAVPFSHSRPLAWREARDRRRMTTRGLEAPRMIVMLLGDPVVGVAENQRGVADVLRIVNRDRGRGCIAKHVRAEAPAERVAGMDEYSPRQRPGFKLGSDLRHPDCGEGPTIGGTSARSSARSPRIRTGRCRSR